MHNVKWLYLLKVALHSFVFTIVSQRDNVQSCYDGAPSYFVSPGGWIEHGGRTEWSRRNLYFT
jgi:hypothetical protein